MTANPSPPVVAPHVRDLGILAAALADWLADRMPAARGIRIDNLAYPLGAGMSHETILFDAAWREDGSDKAQGMVVRIKPTENTVYPDDLFDRQYRLIELMHEFGAVRVARPLWFESDAALLGAPFFIMEKVAGRVAVSYPPYAKQGWLVDTPATTRRRIWESAVTSWRRSSLFRSNGPVSSNCQAGRTASTRKPIAGAGSSTGSTRRASASCCAPRSIGCSPCGRPTGPQASSGAIPALAT